MKCQAEVPAGYVCHVCGKEHTPFKITPKQVGIAILILCIICYLAYQYLNKIYVMPRPFHRNESAFFDRNMLDSGYEWRDGMWQLSEI